MRWSLPNTITLARIATLPIILALVWPGIETRETCFWAAVMYAASGILDIVDGALARRTGQVTVMGKFLDPLADKVFHLVALVAMLQLDGPRVPPVIVMIILVRELAITGLRAMAASEGIVIAAGDGGKIKTTLGTAGMCGLMIHYPYVMNFGFTHALVNPHNVGLMLTYISVLFSVVSGVNYMRGFALAMRDRPLAT